jgi:hypothetical protein
MHPFVCKGRRITLPVPPGARARRACWLVLPLCLLVLAAGCGGPRRTADHIKLTGKVTYKNKPVTGGTLNFVTSDGFSSRGVIDPEGNYSIDAPVGEAKITVDNRMLNPTNRGARMPQAGRGPGRPGDEPTPVKGTYVAIPNKYYTPDTSDLTVKVTKDLQTYDITLNDNPAPGSGA